MSDITFLILLAVTLSVQIIYLSAIPSVQQRDIRLCEYVTKQSADDCAEILKGK